MSDIVKIIWAPLKTLGPRRLGRQIAFCDPQIPQYSVVLKNNFPASQLRLEVLRDPHLRHRSDFKFLTSAMTPLLLH